uniref:C2H2-type domain-containing protein n=1 Tax=Parascaris univalens TaxID=6257 RepID=A0A915BW14_PARUN
MKLKAMNRIKEEIKESSGLTDVYTMIIYRCKYCDHLIFDNEASLRKHTQEQHSPEVLAYSCMFCSAFISSLESFMVHLRTSHPKETVSSTDRFASRLEAICKDNVVTVFYTFAPLAEVVWPQSDGVSEDSDCHHRPSNDEPSLTTSSKSNLKNATSKCAQNESAIERTPIAESSSTVVKMDIDEAQEIDTEVKQLVNQPAANGILQHSDRLRDIESFSAQLPRTSMYRLEVTPSTAELPWRLTAPSIGPKNKAQTCQKCGQKFKNWCMFTRHMIDHKRARNPYKCLVHGCLESYVDRKKLLGHLSCKHPTLSQTDKEAMLLRGDAANALIQHDGRSRMECSAAEGATLNALMNNGSIEEDSSHLLSSERAQNLRELRANRRSRISQLGADGIEEETGRDESTSGTVSANFTCQAPSVSVTARVIAPLNISPQYTLLHPRRTARKVADRGGISKESELQKSESVAVIKQKKKAPAKKSFWKTKVTVRQLLGKEAPRRGGATKGCAGIVEWSSIQELHHLTPPILPQCDQGEGPSLLAIKRETIAD